METIKEYQDQLAKAAKMIHEAYRKGRDDERKYWVEAVPMGFAVITIQARSEDAEHVDNIRVMLSKEQISGGREDFVSLALRDTIRKIVYDGKIIKTWLDPQADRLP